MVNQWIKIDWTSVWLLESEWTFYNVKGICMLASINNNEQQTNEA